MTSLQRVYVVIPTFNGEPWLEACLASVRASSVVTQCIVVDNASTDATVQIANGSEGCQVLQNVRNLGFGRASNRGLRAALDAGAAWVLLLNQDTVLRPDTLAHLLAFAESTTDVGVVVPLQLRPDGEGIDPVLVQHYLPRFAGSLIDAAILRRAAEPVEVQSAPAAAWLMSRRALETVGGFDPIFFMYGEDDDYAHRVHRHGLSMWLVPAAQYRHLRGAYQASERAGALARLKRTSSRHRAALIAQVKTSHASLGKAAWKASVMRLSEGLGEALAHAKPAAMVSALAGVIGLLTALPTIAKHKARESTADAHWL